jgi:hypothetical protein
VLLNINVKRTHTLRQLPRLLLFVCQLSNKLQPLHTPVVLVVTAAKTSWSGVSCALPSQAALSPLLFISSQVCAIGGGLLRIVRLVFYFIFMLTHALRCCVSFLCTFVVCRRVHRRRPAAHCWSGPVLRLHEAQMLLCSAPFFLFAIIAGLCD